MKKIYILVSLVFILLSGCSSSNNDLGDVSNGLIKKPDSVKVGVLFDFSGGDAIFSGYGLKVLEMAVNETNLNGGINGVPIELVVRDGKCTPVGGRDAARELVDLGVKFIVGGICSDETLGAASVTDPARVILISPSSTSPSISEAGDFVFRTVPSDGISARSLASYVFDKGYENIAILSENTAFTSGVRVNFIEAFEELGGTIEIKETFETIDEDLSDEVLAVKNSNSDGVLFLVLGNDPFRKLVGEMEKQELDLPLFTGEYLESGAAREGFEEFLTGTVYPGLFVSRDDEKTIKFTNSLIEVYGEDFTLKDHLYYLASVYDLEKILAMGLNACDFDDSVCVRDYFYSLESFDGIIGVNSFNELGDSDLMHSIIQFDGEDFSVVD